MLKLLDVNTIALTILGYPMSWVELVGTIFTLWSVWLVARRNIWTWPIGIVSVLLYAALFYQIRLYADTLEQVYFLGASLYGWWHWTRPRSDNVAGPDVQFSPTRELGLWGAGTLLLSLALTLFLYRAPTLFPVFFPEPASYPFADALTTIMSFTAAALMARKRVECWLYWIAVDVIDIWLYAVKGVRFVALLYVVLLFMACGGFRSWWKAERVEMPPPA